MGFGLGEGDLVGFGRGLGFGFVTFDGDGPGADDGSDFVGPVEGSVTDPPTPQATPRMAVTARRMPRRLTRLPAEALMAPMVGGAGNRAFTLR